MAESDGGNLYIQVKISEDLKTFFREGSDEMKAALNKELQSIGFEGEERIKRSMQNTGKAHWFYLRPNGAIHWPSAPGHPPAIDSGRLISSIVFDSGDGRLEIGSEDKGGVVAQYAVYLEEGTDKMKARPFIQKVADWMEGVIEERLLIVVRTVTEGRRGNW